MKVNNLYEPFQSAYREHGSTETALLKVQDHIIRSLDKGRGVILLLLDLSAAFDTVSHELLIDTLQNDIGVTGHCLHWLRDYLSNRFQSVHVGMGKSVSIELECGVPQGSVLGPLLFSIYTSPLGRLLRSQGINYHFFADDSQIYMEFDLSEQHSLDAVVCLESVVDKVRDWMKSHKLILNDNKTELLVFRPKSAGNTHFIPHDLTVGDETIQCCETARNLGALFDNTMSMAQQINNLCRASYFHLRAIGRVRKFLDQATTKQLAHALIISRLDCHNSLLYGIPSTLLKKLQNVQNACARLIFRAPKREHVTPLYMQLHWLPIECRIQYKILLLTYKALNGLAPNYLSELLVPHAPIRQLRSANQLKLVQPRTRTRYGDRSFSCAAPTLWNELPIAVRRATTLTSFKVNLKTHIFKKHYQVQE